MSLGHHPAHDRIKRLFGPCLLLLERELKAFVPVRGVHLVLSSDLIQNSVLLVALLEYLLVVWERDLHLELGLGDLGIEYEVQSAELTLRG